MRKQLVFILSIVIFVLCVNTGTAQNAGENVSVLNGSWRDTGAPMTIYRFDNGIFEELMYDSLFRRGTYTVTDGVLTIYVTHMPSRYLTERFSNGWGSYLTWEEDMVSLSQAREEMINRYIEMEIGWFGGKDTPEERARIRAEAERRFDNTFGEMYRPKSFRSFYIRGDILFMEHEWGTKEWRRL